MSAISPSRAFPLPRLRLSRWRRGFLPRIAGWEERIKDSTDAEIRKQSLSLRFRAQSGGPGLQLLPEAFALVREASRRAIGLRHHDVQMLAGIAMHFGSIAELQTGEGKTLAATAPVYLAALRGKGAHVATVNDYLAGRDAEWMGPVYRALGLTVGVVESQMPEGERRNAYQCDITYGTAKEFGFDFLRDRLQTAGARQSIAYFAGAAANGHSAPSGKQQLQRGWEFCIIDEADSILIDEARTPLIISGMASDADRQKQLCFHWAAKFAPLFAFDEDVFRDEKSGRFEFTSPGARRLRGLPTDDLEQLSQNTLADAILRAVKVNQEFNLDQHYVIREGKIVIVDEETGRLAEGRQWRDGIHQAIEAKEELELSPVTAHSARVTIHGYFRRYRRLAGMTATAASAAAELRSAYGLGVIQVPTHRPCIRQQLPPVICRTVQQKWHAVADEIVALHQQQRPILIGTRSIERSEHLSQMLSERGIPHAVLNARNPEQEAEIVAAAGQPSKVTVATNMAGRGTDIKLGPGVAEKGGLHVICTELHDSARIDRQLQGRCARQGDPGSFRVFVSFEDQVLRDSQKDPPRTASPADKATSENGDGEIEEQASNEAEESASSPTSKTSRLQPFLRAQRKIERKHFKQRKALRYFSDQRQKMQREMGQDPYLDLAE